ncbi:MAG: TetR/AcrR family transcriptional regulator [Propionibacteriaceae bacterium]|nr:TetR/AcrR family transcriptional regulator [Propionibacteriaceae bacterium]
MTKQKAAPVRRAEILDVAERLFVTQGYEQTSVQQVLDAVGIAKGTFYHHFASKEAVMEGIIDRYVSAIAARGEQVLAQHEGGPHQRFLAAVLAMQVQPGGQEQMLTELNKPQNALFHQRTAERTMAIAVPILATVVREGVDQGAFRTDYPEEALELVLHYTAQVLDDLDPQHAATPRKLIAFVHHTELLLGAEPGSLAFILDLFTNASAAKPEVAP